MRTLTIILLSTIFLTIPLYLSPLSLSLTSLTSPTPQISTIHTNAKSNISLSIHGSCHPGITYIGVDSRVHLLHHYHIYAVPLVKYSPPKMNWARVVLLLYVLRKCRGWVVYSDTDAYMYRIPDMKTFRESQHVVYQHGMLSLNSGFHAWRTTNKSLEIAANWMARYMVTKDFFAEQTAMKKTCEYRYPGECTARNNGFLGWHMKGSAKYKYRLGSIGRWFYAMRHALPIAFWVYVLLLIFLLHVSLSGKPGDTFRTLSNILVSKRIIAIVLFVLTIYVALTQFPRQQMDAKRMCSRNYTHVLPGGKIMVDRDFICDPNFKCAKGGMWFYFWTAVSKIENRTVVFFIVCSVIEQTRVLWVYGVFVIIAMVYRRLVNVRSGTAKEGASLDEERG